MRNFLKLQLEKIKSNFLERLLGLSLLKENFSEIRNLPKFDNREKLWKDVFNKFHNKPVTVLEFGVYQGCSIQKFAKLNLDPRSKFYGFDSFEGLPEDWTDSRKKGAFNIEGNLPKIDDKRISFVKGWFQNTLSNFLQNTNFSGEIFVHYDADIFSATLYAMLKLDKFKLPYYAVFDEFSGHETHALYRYMQISGAKVELIASTGNKMYPVQVSCRITPAKKFTP